MSTIKSKYLSAPINGTTVEPLALQTNNIDRVTVSPSGAVAVVGALTAGSLQVGGVATDIRPLVSDTAKTATGTSVDFTGIPSWARRVTVMFNGVSTNGSSGIRVQIGAGSVTTTGYLGSTSAISAAAAGSSALSSGFDLSAFVGAADVFHGALVLTLQSSNVWIASGVFGMSNTTRTCFIGGGVPLSGTLDRLRITAINGTDTLDSGSINIMWE